MKEHWKAHIQDKFPGSSHLEHILCVSSPTGKTSYSPSDQKQEEDSYSSAQRRRIGHYVGGCPIDIHLNYNHPQRDNSEAFPVMTLSTATGIFDRFELGLDTLSGIKGIKELPLV